MYMLMYAIHKGVADMLAVLSALILSLTLAPDAEFLSMLDDYTIGSRLLFFGPQLAIERVDFRRPSGALVSDVWLGAVSLGNNDIAVFEVDFGGSTPEICGMETITFPDNNDRYAYYTFDPTLMELPVNGIDEWCLVVPVIEREDNPSGSDPAEDGNIMIVRLESRDANHELITINDGLGLGQAFSSYVPTEVYYCMENPDTGDYLISFSSPLYDVLCIASFNQIRNKFDVQKVFEIDEYYTAHNNRTFRCRPYESFYFDQENSAAYLTNHNGGVAVWDYSSSSIGGSLPLLSRIAVQQGGWQSSNSSNFEELGDVHRAAVLEADAGPGNDSKLLFFGNHVMGFLVYDVTDPSNPNFVFHWDHDTKPYDWESWSGAGAGDAPVASDCPAVIFGLDVRGHLDSGKRIHLYAGNGSDGLLTVDFTEFLRPWSTFTDREEFAALDEHRYPLTYSPTDYWAYDLRTFQHGSDVYVLTSWREPPGSGNHYSPAETGTIALTLHIDNVMTLPFALDFRETGAEECVLEPIRLMAVNTPNPAADRQMLTVNANRETFCTVQAYDLAGRMVRHADVYLNSGTNTIFWTELPGAVLPSGSYIIRVTASSGEEIISKSVILN